MEFEFEHTVLESQAGSDVYRKRFYEYMRAPLPTASTDRSRWPTTTVRTPWCCSQSQSAVDRELYHEFCQFVLNNPCVPKNAGK